MPYKAPSISSKSVIPAINRVSSVGYSATITPNTDTTDLLVVGTLTGPLSIANPTGTPVDGQRLRIRLTQDATGRVVTLGTAFNLPTGDSIPSTASIRILIGCEYDSSVSKWQVVAIKVTT